ncbi:MAG: ABC transporter permease subunit, partial [Thermoanaerobaculia bacterium]
MTTVEHDDEPTITPADSGETRVGRWQVSTEALRAYTMVFALIVIWIFFQWRTVSDLYPYGLFLHPVNFANLLKQMSVTGVLAVGMLFVIVARQIDLSVGSILGLVGGVAAMSQGWGLVPALSSAIVIGIAVGALQGSLVAYLNIPSFIVTLGGLLTWRGVILYLSKGETIPVRLPFFRLLGVALLTPASGWS